MTSRSAPHEGIADFGAFVDFLQQRFVLIAGEVSADVDLRDELGLDSLQLYEILLTLEEADVVLDEDEIEGVRTMGELHGLVTRYLAAAERR